MEIQESINLVAALHAPSMLMSQADEAVGNFPKREENR
jgi:hypothetical protein